MEGKTRAEKLSSKEKLAQFSFADRILNFTSHLAAKSAGEI
jgi:hypothetical protein